MIDSRRNPSVRVLVLNGILLLLALGCGEKTPSSISAEPQADAVAPTEDALDEPGVPDSTDQTDTEDTLTDASKPEEVDDEDTVPSDSVEVDSEEGSETPEEGLEATAVPYTAGGLLGRYSERGTNEEGETTITPLFERLDAVVDFPGEDASFGEHAPVNGLEVSWEGGFFAESAGEYEFQLTAADTGSIAFGNDEILSFEDTGSYTTEKAKISLGEGWHPIRVHYRSGNNTALVVLSVRAPGAFMEAVQSNLLGVPSIPPESEPRLDSIPSRWRKSGPTEPMSV